MTFGVFTEQLIQPSLGRDVELGVPFCALAGNKVANENFIETFQNAASFWVICAGME